MNTIKFTDRYVKSLKPTGEQFQISLKPVIRISSAIGKLRPKGNTQGYRWNWINAAHPHVKAMLSLATTYEHYPECAHLIF